MTKPQALTEYIGQENLKAELKLKIESALQRQRRLDHVLLVGVPGCGKSTLARIIANEMYSDYEEFIMPVDTKLIESLMYEYTGVVLLDEIHRMTKNQQEIFLPILWDGYMQLKSGQRIENGEITWVGATTKGDRIDDAIRDRFRIRPVFDTYTDSEMAQIVKRMAAQEGLAVTKNMALKLAQASLGAPRNAETIVDTVRDLKLRNDVMPTVDQVLTALRLTPSGLGIEHIRYTEALAAAGGQAGIQLLCSLLSMPRGSVEQLEVDLIRQGFMTRTNTGRRLTQQGYRLAGLSRFGTRNNRSNR